METVGFFFTLCLLHLAAFPAKVMKVLKKKTERTCSDSSSRDLPSRVVLTATLRFIFFFSSAFHLCRSRGGGRSDTVNGPRTCRVQFHTASL